MKTGSGPDAFPGGEGGLGKDLPPLRRELKSVQRQETGATGDAGFNCAGCFLLEGIGVCGTMLNREAIPRTPAFALYRDAAEAKGPISAAMNALAFRASRTGLAPES